MVSKQQAEWTMFQKKYDTVCSNEIAIQTSVLIKTLFENQQRLKTYKKNYTVLARQLKQGEHVNVVDSNHQLNKITTQKGQWLVQQQNENRTQTIINEADFEFLYDVENPIKGKGAIKIYSLRNNIIKGMFYEGNETIIQSSNKGNILLKQGDFVSLSEGLEKGKYKLEYYSNEEVNTMFSPIENF
jgi:hypothetical protein